MTTTRDEVERRLRSTFHGKADQLEVHAVPLDLSAVADEPAVLVDVEPRRRRTAVVFAAVALVVVVALVGIVVQTGVLGDGSSDRAAVRTRSGKGPATPTVPAASAAPLLAPATPAGMQLWSINSERVAADPIVSTQLFGALDANGALAPGLLIEMQPASPGAGIRPGGPTDATVRGHAVTVDPGKDAGEGTQEFAWIEGGAEVRVTVRGGSVAQAVQILDALKPRGPNLTSGFDPASAPPGITQLGEAPKSSATDTGASFAYGRSALAVGRPADLVVWTSTGASYPGYLRIWIAGSRTADQVAVEFDPGVGVFVAWPDRRQAVAISSSLDRAALEAAAKSVTLLPPADARQLREDLTTRLLALPVLTSVDLPSGTLDLRGNGAPATLCFHRGAQDAVCANPDYQQYQAAPRNALTGSVEIGGQWLVFAADTVPPLLYQTPPGPFSFPSSLAKVIDAEVATANGWHLALLEVPADVDQVTVSPDGVQTSTRLTRPGTS